MAEPLRRPTVREVERPREEELDLAVTKPKGPIATTGLFLWDTTRHALKVTPAYGIWMGSLGAIMIAGAYAYSMQIAQGLSVTGMNDQVSWGLYISNFTFLVGVAAAAVMLVLPTYVLKDIDFRKAVLIGEGIAVGALIMCLAFVTVDLGGPQRFWHMIPGLGKFNWPVSMLAWDVIVLNGYLALNVSIPFYLLYCKYKGVSPKKKAYLPFVVLSVFWAVSIHLVTAFLYASQPGKPFWHSALLGPRFLASAFAAGPALIILVLSFINSRTRYKIENETIRKISLIVTGAAQINLVMLACELFVLFYHPTGHTASARYLFFGLHGHNALVGWIWPSVIANVLATAALSIHRIRRNRRALLALCGTLFVAIWIEKGMGLIVPGFTPTALGEIVDYHPSMVEVMVTLGIWALGIAVITVLVRTGIAVELGNVALGERAISVEKSGTMRRRRRPQQQDEDQEAAVASDSEQAEQA